jgi:hypothetical protein
MRGENESSTLCVLNFLRPGASLRELAADLDASGRLMRSDEFKLCVCNTRRTRAVVQGFPAATNAATDDVEHYT